MSQIEPPAGALLAARCHDVTVCLRGKAVADFDQLTIIGMAVRLALHLRGVPAVAYDLLRQVALHLLQIPPTALRAVMQMLAEAEFVRLHTEGGNIRSVVPVVPFYEDLFQRMGEVAGETGLSEPEMLTLSMLDRLAKSPTVKSAFYEVGAEKNLVERMVQVGRAGGYVTAHRARGRDMLASPIYFPENADAFADLAAGNGSGRVARVISLLARHQGWPLALIERQERIGDDTLSPEEVRIVRALADEGFAPPPMIETSHSGANSFLFGPKPGFPRLIPTKRHIYECAMALVAAVRQGQLLPARFAIRWPVLLLSKLRDAKRIGASSEAIEQYRALAVMRVGRLETTPAGRAEFHLINTEENREAVDLALLLVQGDQPPPVVSEEVLLALHQGQTYVDSLVGRQVLVDQETVELGPESRREIEDLFLKARS
ncbi:MAG: hypothetical protein HY682_04765 [Chloroflexi bacterium]|nr:hypothetical protein [Chloroflexota bacterium]